jgi:flagellar motor switch protein FliM
MQMRSIAEARAVIERFSERPRLDPDRLPVLNSIIEKVSVSGVEFLRKFCAAQMVFLMNKLTSARSVDFLNEEQDAIGSVYKIPEWDSLILIGLDRKSLNLFIDGAFGGDGAVASPDITRPFTSLDVRLARALCDHLANGLADGFHPISKITPIYERVETKLDAQSLGPKAYDVVVAWLRLQAFGEEGRVFICLPAAALALLRPQFEQNSGTGQQADPEWTRQLGIEVGQAVVPLTAVLGSLKMTLREISHLRVGQVIDLDAELGGPVILESEGEQLFKCRVGQLNRNLTLTIEAPISADELRQD